MKFKEGDRGWVTTPVGYELLVEIKARVNSFYLVRVNDGATDLFGASLWVAEEEFSQRAADIRPQVDVLSRLKKNLDEVRGKTAPAKPEHDPVNHPAHYTSGAIECIDAVQAALTPEEFRGFLKGQVIKYTWRGGKKDDAAQDAAKAVWYAERLKKVLGTR